MSKKKKQNKKKPKAPPLSKLDKWIYNIGYIIICSVSILLFVPFYMILEKIRFSDPMVIASAERATLLWLLPLWLYLFLSVFIVWTNLHQTAQPIFGNPNVVYGQSPWQHLYPIFGKVHKKRELRPSHQKYRRQCILYWLIGLLVCLFLAFFGLFGRTSLMQNGDITVYSVFNQEKRNYSIRDVSELEIEAGKKSSGKAGTTWSVWLTFEMTDGKRYSFTSSLENMLQIKSLIDEHKIIIQGVENLDKVIDDQDYTPEELELLYELFEVSA